MGSLASQLLGQLGLQIAVVLFAAGYVLRLVALERVDVEDGAEAAAVGARDALYTDVELAAVGGVGVAGVVPRLVDLARVRTDEAVADLGLVAALDQIGPDADTLLVVVSQAGWALVLGSLTVPARVEDATVGGIGEQAIQARAVRCRDRRLCEY